MSVVRFADARLRGLGEAVAATRAARLVRVTIAAGVDLVRLDISAWRTSIGPVAVACTGRPDHQPRFTKEARETISAAGWPR
jgi:hypothetical protein